MGVEEVVRDELGKMMARRVDYAPTTDDELIGAIRMMVADLRSLNITDEDAERVRAAFLSIALHLGRWPTVYLVREHLPPRPSLPRPDRRVHQPAVLAQTERAIGLDRKPGETAKQQAKRCREWLHNFADPKRFASQFLRAEEEARSEREAIQQESPS